MNDRHWLRFVWPAAISAAVVASTAVAFVSTPQRAAVASPQAAGFDPVAGHQSNGPRTSVRIASPIATLVIRKIRLNERIREGIGKADLRRGVGHYPGTAYPGRPGNVVLLGHRTTGRAPFGKLDRIARGDSLVLNTVSHFFRYEVRRTLIISPRRRSVLHPVPFRAGSTPNGSFLTLITCHPKGSDARRLVVVGKLVESRPG
ncbi:class E sortase [Spirillospora sp. NPDC048911]|uniref:class E sortase n=1 Tax=Spirillospora sp. NPDC048911 TaxID=3364527 RepID=UPI003710A2CD